jgi:hypothetical protein
MTGAAAYCRAKEGEMGRAACERTRMASRGTWRM